MGDKSIKNREVKKKKADKKVITTTSTIPSAQKPK